MPNPWLLLALAATLAATAAGSYRWGHNAALGEVALQRKADIETAYNAGAADLKAETKRAQAAQRERDALAQQLKEIDRDQTPAPRPDCAWSPAEFGLLESRRAAYAGADHSPAASALHGALPGDAADGAGPTADSQGAAGLGLRLPGTAAGVQGLGNP